MLEDPSVRNRLTAAIRGALPSDYTLDRDGDERHGSWEWMASRPDDGVTRVLVTAMTEMGTTAESARVLIDLWAAAETDERFARFQVLHRELSPQTPQDLVDQVEDVLSHVVEAAVDRAEGLSEDDLTEAYSAAGPLTGERSQPIDQTIEPLVDQVFRALEQGEVSLDALAEQVDLPPEHVLLLVRPFVHERRVVVDREDDEIIVRLRD